MSCNQNYTNFRPNFTFHPNVPPPNFIPPPPVPPPFFIPPMSTQTQLDQEFLRKFEKNAPLLVKKQKSNISISEAREKLRNVLMLLEEIKSKEKYLSQNVKTITDDEWQKHMELIKVHKSSIVKECLPSISNMHLDLLGKLVAKRSAKRLRMKRVRLEKKREKDEFIKKSEERSRKIDENLQKIKDDINKKKQEEEAKLQADMVLKEVLRKKTDAKKCLVKLDALLKLRRARENTAKGRGETVSECETNEFNDRIEKLKAIWSQKLIIYEKEELELRDRLKQDSGDQPTLASQREGQVVKTLANWRRVLFGSKSGLPQVDFGGDIARFVDVRTKWDKFVSKDGSPLPIGWVLPSLKTS